MVGRIPNRIENFNSFFLIFSDAVTFDKVNEILPDVAGIYFDELSRFRKQTEEFYG